MDSLLKHRGRCTRVIDKSNGVKWLERDVGGRRVGVSDGTDRTSL